MLGFEEFVEEQQILLEFYWVSFKFDDRDCFNLSFDLFIIFDYFIDLLSIELLNLLVLLEKVKGNWLLKTDDWTSDSIIAD